MDVGFNGPVFLRFESFDGFLALDDQAQRRALHTAGGKPALDLFPQQRRQVETHQVVERAAGLLRIDQVAGQLAGVVDGFLDGALGDFVKGDTMHLLVLEQVFFLQQFVKVPGYGFPFAVLVSREIQRIGLVQCLDDFVDMLLVLLDHLVLHFEVVLGINRAFLGHQVAHMTVGGQHLEILAQVFLNGLGLGR